ncbi:unnamed protein product [Cladocopium goreaui]|uniref:Outer membrane protein PmpB n=1 Tax=Cladocopium goreaui TaxID=2562237 RepID=A0A9P1CCH6_9DINO|nr:unnamed protein product [Cladocopium goreaui]
MQWLLATILVILSPAELRVSKQSTTGQQRSHPVPQPAAETGARHLQDCEVIGWAELCERKKLTAGCFQLQPTAAAPLCELQGPHGAPAQLRPATAGILTLTSAELRITGQIQMTSLRLAAKTVNFADAHVEAWHEAPSDPNSNASGGAFFSEGSFTLTRSRLTVRDVRATTMDGGGFAAGGDLNVRQDSGVVIENVSAKSGAGFLATGNVYISDNSMVFIQNARSTKNGGGFSTRKRLQVSNSSVVSLQNVTTEGRGGGLDALGGVEIAGNSTVSISNSHAEAGSGGGFFTAKGLKVSTGSRLVIRNATTGWSGGGICAIGKTLISRSIVTIQNAMARRSGGGFYTDDEVVIDEMSRVSISTSRSGIQGGGFGAEGRLQVTNSSVVSLQNVIAGTNGGGFLALGEVEIAGNSTVHISNSRAETGAGGGFGTAKGLQVSTGSRLIIRNATTGSHGGGLYAFGKIAISSHSTVKISNSRAPAGSGGGFFTEKGLKVSTGSRLVIRNATAGRQGGGFYAAKGKTTISRSTVSIQNATAKHYGGGFCAVDEVVIDEMSSVSISTSRSRFGGGFHTNRRLQVTNSSFVSLQNVTAQKYGGGFHAIGEVEIAGNSTVKISNSHAEAGSGGGFFTEKGLKVSNGSRLIIRNAAAGNYGGGFYAKGKTLISRSTINIQNATARQLGGGFSAEGVAVIQDSTVAMFSTDAGADGGAFSVFGLTLHRSQLSVSHSTAAGSGSGGRADGQVLLSSESNLVVKDAQGLDNSNVLTAACLHLRDRSHILFEDAVGGHGVELQNSGCSAVCSNSTFHVAEDAALNASGRLSSGLLSLAACPKEKVRLSGIHLRSWSSALLSTRPSSVVVDQVSVEYEPPVNNLQVLAAKDGFEIDSLTVSCQNCTWGVTFNASKDRSLKAVSSEHLQCPKTATASKGLTPRCKCSNYQIAKGRFRDVDVVPLEHIFQTCTFCEPHFHFRNDDCLKRGVFTAWSDGRKDVCHVLPRKKTELVTLLTGGAVVVILTFLAFEILHAPLMITDAKSDLADPTQAESKRTFTLAVQGPIVDLHKSLSRLVNQRVRYRAKGTGLIWLDYDQKKSNAIKVRNTARRKLLLQDTNPPFDCASCKGSLHAADIFYLLSLLTVCILFGALLPAIIKVAVTSGNGVGHVFVTAIYMTLPLFAGAALLHFPVAWLIQRLYRRTSFSEALDEYRKQIHCKPFTGPDAIHPRNQGLQALTLRGLWKHFESFILERNMHFVVANIVTPLTQSKGVSFVTLWGGRRVDYFVSHSWGTSFPHFVQSIQCHALSKEGPTSWIDAAYWICSFANNQWNIGAELGSDPMESAFARTLTAGIKGVAMVLDQEVQPLTRVWCLFEFLLSSREHLELVFVTNAGVIGDDGCSSFDIALEVGKKIKSLQVATCGASSEKDKKDIFKYIISKLGSLERMDEQIRALMAEMLMRNLANVERATGSLVDSLGQGGQGSATGVTLTEERCKTRILRSCSI